MKSLTFLLVMFSLIVSAQFKINVNPDNITATLRGDTLFVHKPIIKPSQYAKFQLSYLRLNGKVYRYKVAYFDPYLMWSQINKNPKKQILIY